MLPHGHTTSYFFAASVQILFLGLGCFDFIFSPEDMADCPLPDGYKPLLLPRLLDIENSIVPYPYRAYLVNYNDIQNYVHKRQSTNSTNILCDLINEYHLDTSYTLDDYKLILPKDSSGFPLSVINHRSSLTINFDFEVLNRIPNHINEQFDIQLFILDTTEIFSVRILSNKIDTRTRTAIKKQIDIDESKFFKTIDGTDESTIQLFGNRTYLVLTKSIEQWSEYAIIVDISISNLPATDEYFTIFSTNSQSEIYTTHRGKIRLFSNGQVNKSRTPLQLNEYMRLLINIPNDNVEININGILQICANVDHDQFLIKTNRIDLFREVDLTMNTLNDEVLRIQCKSITFLNRSIKVDLINKQMKSSNYSLTSLVAPTFPMIPSNLISIAYKDEWIKFFIKENNTTNIQFIDTIIRE
ncbi:unnamed protein product [Rotaria sp. Silwood1]|nr:unnamed protein product [Rotaria sp. Silwood1]